MRSSSARKSPGHWAWEGQGWKWKVCLARWIKQVDRSLLGPLWICRSVCLFKDRIRWCYSIPASVRNDPPLYPLWWVTFSHVPFLEYVPLWGKRIPSGTGLPYGPSPRVSDIFMMEYFIFASSLQGSGTCSRRREEVRERSHKPGPQFLQNSVSSIRDELLLEQTSKPLGGRLSGPQELMLLMLGPPPAGTVCFSPWTSPECGMVERSK